MDQRRSAHLRCSSCGKEYELEGSVFRCACGGLFDLAGFRDVFDERLLDGTAHGVFRYRLLMPSAVDAAWQDATMAEGWTGNVRLRYKGTRVLAKMDYCMPTLSFKDRGAAVMMAAAKARGALRVVQDSSGNAGNSVAAYAARLGIKCTIFVPASTSPNKVRQIMSYGAEARLVQGTREDTATAALAEAEAGAYYASHVYDPLFYQGTKTYLYELWEQCGGKLPDALAVPVGNGTLLLGVLYGIRSLIASGALSKPPEIIAVQASNCAPVAKAFKSGAARVEPVINEGTSAEGIAIAAPKRGAQLLGSVKELGGTFVQAGEDEIEDAGKALAGMGVYVEPTSAATIAGASSWAKESGFDGEIAVPMCGAGLKSLH